VYCIEEQWVEAVEMVAIARTAAAAIIVMAAVIVRAA